MSDNPLQALFDSLDEMTSEDYLELYHEAQKDIEKIEILRSLHNYCEKEFNMANDNIPEDVNPDIWNLAQKHFKIMVDNSSESQRAEAGVETVRDVYNLLLEESNNSINLADDEAPKFEERELTIDSLMNHDPYSDFREKDE